VVRVNSVRALARFPGADIVESAASCNSFAKR
jgi:hypothetical protein